MLDEAGPFDLVIVSYGLLQLEAPLPGKNASVLAVPQVPIVVGSRFTIAGIGVTIRGDGKSGGTVRTADLVATGNQDLA